MKKLRQLPIGTQVLFTFGTLCVVLLIIGGLFFFSLRSIERSNQVQQSRALNKLALIDDTAQDVGQMQAEALRQVLASDIEEIKRLDQTVRGIEGINAKELADYQALADTEKEKQLYDRVMQARKAYWQQTQPGLTLGLSNRDTKTREFIISKQAPAYDEFLKALNELIKYVETDANETAKATTRFISEIRIIGDVLVGVTILIAIGTGFAVAGVARRLKEDNRFLQIEVTERRRAEETLRESEEKFRQLAENITDVLWITSPDMRMIYVSPAYEGIWGRSMDSLYADPRQWVESILPEERERVSAAFAGLGADRPSVSVEYRISRPDGTTRWLHDRGFVVRDVAGNVIRHTGIAADITERKRFEAQLFQSQKMETVGKLAGGVAHEFNSIMTTIIGQSELLLNDLPPGNRLCKNATEIGRAADRAATLTRQLLAYGRKQILQPETLDLNSVLAGMESTLRHLMGRGTDVRIAPTAGLKAVKADAGQIEQVIVNMVMNAADAMPNGGKLTFEAANVTLDPEYVSHFPELKAGEYVMLTITDTGAGMCEEVKRRVFEPFFTTKGVGQGTGLGLSTCYGIIKQSGGHISVSSELGKGTVFKVYLPQTEPEAKVAPHPYNSPDLPRGTETILLVEDDPSLREMAATLLRRLGYTVLAVANGVEALSLKQQRDIGHIDLLFTDVVIPHMSVKEFSARVRALYPYTKILFTSAYTENAIVRQGVLNDGVMFLQKPFAPSALALKVREVLDEPNALKPDTAQKTDVTSLFRAA